MIAIEDFLEFIPEKTKYSIIRLWQGDSKGISHFMLLKKNIGNAERYIVLFVFTQRDIRGDILDTDNYSSQVFLLGEGESHKIPKSIIERIGADKLLKKDIFLKDLKRQEKKNQIHLSKLVAKFLLESKPLKEVSDIKGIDISWSDYPIFEKINHSFEIDNQSITFIDETDGFQSSEFNLDILLE